MSQFVCVLLCRAAYRQQLTPGVLFYPFLFHSFSFFLRGPSPPISPHLYVLREFSPRICLNRPRGVWNFVKLCKQIFNSFLVLSPPSPFRDSQGAIICIPSTFSPPLSLLYYNTFVIGLLVRTIIISLLGPDGPFFPTFTTTQPDALKFHGQLSSIFYSRSQFAGNSTQI